MTKIFCDLCGKEIKRSNGIIVDISSWSTFFSYLNNVICDKCYGRLLKAIKNIKKEHKEDEDE